MFNHTEESNLYHRKKIKEVAMAFVDIVQDNITGTSRAHGLVLNLYMPYCMVWKILRQIIHVYPNKIWRGHESYVTSTTISD